MEVQIYYPCLYHGWCARVMQLTDAAFAELHAERQKLAAITAAKAHSDSIRQVTKWLFSASKPVESSHSVFTGSRPSPYHALNIIDAAGREPRNSMTKCEHAETELCST